MKKGMQHVELRYLVPNYQVHHRLKITQNARRCDILFPFPIPYFPIPKASIAFQRSFCFKLHVKVRAAE